MRHGYAIGDNNRTITEFMSQLVHACGSEASAAGAFLPRCPVDLHLMPQAYLTYVCTKMKR